METTYLKQLWGTPFTLEWCAVKNKPGTWDSTKISIYRDNKLIGEYLRNYPIKDIKTFYPFCIDGDWYALYSPHYTATRVMRIYDDRIEDWCGEGPSVAGFCPAEYYVPRYNHFKSLPDGYEYYTVDNGYENITKFFEESKTSEFVNSGYCNFAFLSGCHWGDDSNYKLRYIDLSKVKDREISIENKFGYWPLPTNLELKQCINIDNWEPDNNWIGLTRSHYVNLSTGEQSD